MDVVVYLGGGGSLGAFDAGVWSALAPRLDAIGARVAVLAGASIGAINAACVARDLHAGDRGAGALARMWTEELATPSVPFNGPLAWSGARDAESWNGVLTGLLVGNRRLYRAAPANWNAMAGLSRARQPLMDRSAQYAWLEQRVGALPVVGADMPLVCVPCVDVISGGLVLFDNANVPLDVRALAASSAIPLLFEPVEIDGRLYWDGDMTRESALPAILERVSSLARGQGPRERLLIAVDHMSRTSTRRPESGIEMTHRLLEVLLAGKTHVDDSVLGAVDHVLRIERTPMRHDAISGQFDYSPARISELIAQGREQAEQAWAAAGLDRRAGASATSTENTRPVH